MSYFASSSSNNGTNRVLERTLNEILAVIKPSQEDITARTRVIDELKAVVNQSAAEYSSLRGAAVLPFGSYMCNLYTKWGDLDISIQTQNQGLLLLQSTALGDLDKAMRRRGQTFRITKYIPRARVPLLVVESNNHNNITCDISINNSAGVMKSLLLHFVAEIEGRFRDMVLLVKEWAKSEDINSARDGTLNSYALCLLVIYHFQTCKPPILPPLKELHTGQIVAGRSIYSVYGDDFINQMNANVERFKRGRLINTSSLSELFVSFFQKFSAVETRNFNYFCTYTGTWEHKTYTEKWEETSEWFRGYLDDIPMLNIKDPFARDENAARSVEDTTKIFKAFPKTYAMLLSASGRDRFSLISNLVKPEVGALMITRG